MLGKQGFLQWGRGSTGHGAQMDTEAELSPCLPSMGKIRFLECTREAKLGWYEEGQCSL